MRIDGYNFYGTGIFDILPSITVLIPAKRIEFKWLIFEVDVEW